MYIKYTMGTFYEDVFKSEQSSVIISENTHVYIEAYHPNSSTVNILETIVASIVAFRFISDAVTISETTASVQSKTRFDLDSVSISDDVIADKIFPRHASDTITLSESTSVYIYDSIGKAKETITISENVSVVIYLNIIFSENVTISESVSYLATPTTYHTYVETISIVDTGTYSIFQPILLSELDTVTVAETSTILFNKFPLNSDTIEISETASTYINSIGLGSIPKSLTATVNILESSVSSIYRFKVGASGTFLVQNNYTPPLVVGVLVDSIITTSFISSDIIIVPSYKTITSTILSVLPSTLLTDISGVEISNIRLNIHQIKTWPEGATLDYGFIKENTLKDFTIISGEPTDLEISEILIPAFFGVEVVGIDVGSILPAGGTLDFQVLAYSDIGRDEIDDFLTIHFIGGQKVQIFIKLVRVVVFDLFITPDRNSYQETLSYYTLTFESINNIIKTKVMMEQPKYSVKYEITVFQTKKHRAYLNLFRHGLTRPILHPLWGQSVEINYSSVGSYTIDGAWDECDFSVGDTVFVFKGVDEYRLAKIISLTAETMLLDKKFDLEPGYIVTPSFYGVVKGTVKTSYTGERFMKGNIVVEEFYPNA